MADKNEKMPAPDRVAHIIREYETDLDGFIAGFRRFLYIIGGGLVATILAILIVITTT